jgi:hypothetical protein
VIANSSMRALLRDPGFLGDRPVLQLDTQSIVDAGWTIGPGGALLLAARTAQGRLELPESEIGGYEYDINDVHISLDDMRDSEGLFLAKAASRAVFFAVQLLEKGAALPGAASLVASVAVTVAVDDEYFSLQGAKVRFFTRRGDPLDWFDDLEKFRIEAIGLFGLPDVPAYRRS